MILASLSACESSPVESLSGRWELDSVYYFYNGFGYTQPSSSGESYEYFSDGAIIARYQGQEEKFQYAVNARELKYTDANGGLFSQYEIVDVDENRLVLKKEKMPLFERNNQKRYEIRYFSKQNLTRR